MKFLTRTEKGLRFKISTRQYSDSVLHKCFYWYSNNYDVIIVKEEDAYIISIEKNEGTFDYNFLVAKIKRDLIDYNLREIVERETSTIRELLIAKAFSHFEEVQSPVTSVSDPIGFDPNSIK